MPSDLSRLRSTVSSSPLRTFTDRPQPSEASAPASVAPVFGVGQGAIDEVFKERAAVAETAVGGTHALGMLGEGAVAGAARRVRGAAGRVDFMARL